MSKKNKPTEMEKMEERMMTTIQRMTRLPKKQIVEMAKGMPLVLAFGKGVYERYYKYPYQQSNITTLIEMIRLYFQQNDITNAPRLGSGIGIPSFEEVLSHIHRPLMMRRPAPEVIDYFLFLTGGIPLEAIAKYANQGATDFTIEDGKITGAYKMDGTPVSLDDEESDNTATSGKTPSENDDESTKARHDDTQKTTDPNKPDDAPNQT